MKTLLLLPLAIALPAFAGTSAKQVVAPPPDTCLTTWFAGASVGYLEEMDTAMYNVHVGVTNSCWNIAGWNIALYTEVGYAQKSWTYDLYRNNYAVVHPIHEDIMLEVVPITADIKFERNLTGNLNAYFGGGLGMAWMHVDSDLGGSDSDWVFTAQVFAGLSYNVTPSCEVYGGARWIYYDDPTLYGAKVDLGNLPGFSGNIGSDWLFELGARFKF